MTVKNRLKAYIYDRAPNSLLEEHILLEFSELQPSVLLQQVSELVDEGFLLMEVMPPNPRCPTLQRKSYRITVDSLGDYPINTEIEAAGIKVPRLIDGDRARAEDVNSLIYAVNKIIEANAKQLELKMEEQNRRYWGAIATIFALFVSLFSIVNVGVKPALFAADLALSPISLLFQSLLNLAPLTVVLLLFAWLLHKILGK
jgi:hypothetical protein